MNDYNARRYYEDLPERPVSEDLVEQVLGAYHDRYRHISAEEAHALVEHRVDEGIHLCTGCGLSWESDTPPYPNELCIFCMEDRGIVPTD